MPGGEIFSSGLPPALPEGPGQFPESEKEEWGQLC
jgi:hypothetical protein